MLLHVYVVLLLVMLLMVLVEKGLNFEVEILEVLVMEVLWRLV